MIPGAQLKGTAGKLKLLFLSNHDCQTELRPSGKRIDLEHFKHLEHETILSNRRGISSISFENIFEQKWAFFEQNQAYFELGTADPTVKTNSWQILQPIWKLFRWILKRKMWKAHIFHIFATEKVQIFSIFPNQVWALIFEHAFQALSFDPSHLHYSPALDLWSSFNLKSSKIWAFSISILVQQLNQSQIWSDPMLSLKSTVKNR